MSGARSSQPDATAPRVVWIVVRPDGLPVAEVPPCRSRALAEERMRKDWKEQVVGPYVLLDEPEEWADRPMPEDAAIKAAFPTRSGRHDLYAKAMRLVGARHSKGALVALVTWLLLEIETGGRDGG